MYMTCEVTRHVCLFMVKFEDYLANGLAHEASPSNGFGIISS